MSLQQTSSQEREQLLKELKEAKAEAALCRKDLAEAQAKLATSSNANGDRIHTAVNRSHVSRSQSQYPTSDALVRLAQKHDASIIALRRGQLEVIHTLYGNKDCAAFMPTGGGKSLVWLLHNILSTEQLKTNALTVVVVPFTATIDSHVAKTQQWGNVISSQDSLDVMAQKISTASWLYTTPEKIVHNDALKWCSLLRSQAHRVSLVVYDEAHEWLESWRSGTQDCVKILQDMFPTCCRLACTATCRVSDAAVLIDQLSMEQGANVVRCSVDRKNCYLHVTAMTNETADVAEIFGKLRRQQRQQIPQALVFVTSQDQAERMELLFKKQATGDASSSFTEEMIASYRMLAHPKNGNVLFWLHSLLVKLRLSSALRHLEQASMCPT